jgi:8-oxo-dGTP pyrophosphatase MutT (NUDIX family)/phosphohistidine phosphatase SixA
VAAPSPVLAAGAVVWRDGPEEPEVLTVHRTKHQDWTLPKGKLDPGERLPTTAVRELLEETAVAVRLGLPLPKVSYPFGDAPGTKEVSYWVGRPVGDPDAVREADHEVDEVRWVPVSQVPELLTYEPDRDLVAQLEHLRARGHHDTSPLVVLRHGHARRRDDWHGEDRLRPLSEEGLAEAQRLVPLLAAFGVERVVSSDATRCRQTVEPFAAGLGVTVEVHADLDEEHADDASVARRLAALLADPAPSVLCTHRPLLPAALTAIGVEPRQLEPGELLVAHRHGGEVVGTERHLP